MTNHSIARDLRFVLNGRPVVIEDPDPSMLLSEYLRGSNIGLTGTKVSCGEGGCGACTVALAHFDLFSNQYVEQAVNACLRPLCSVDGMVVTTIEGIGKTRLLNPIQSRIVEYGGSQCGFCTPGFVMTLYAFLRAGPRRTRRDIEDLFDGNLCRCTGFRPILDAMQSFVDDPVAVAAAVGPPLPRSWFSGPRELCFERDGHRWLRLTSLSDVLNVMARDAARPVTLRAGATGAGVYREDRHPTGTLVDISHVAELEEIVDGGPDGALRLGGGVSFARLLEALDGALSADTTGRRRGLSAMRDHVRRIAGHQVRSVATVGGNIMLVLRHAADRPFPSDLFTVLATLSAEVVLRRPETPLVEETYPILDIPAAEAFPMGCVIVAIIVPPTRGGEHVATHKVARRLQNAHAVVNAGFSVVLDHDGVVVESRIVFGGLGARAFAAGGAAAALRGRAWTESVLAEARAALALDVAAATVSMPEEGISDGYRASLADSLFYRFFLAVALEVCPETVGSAVASAGRPPARGVSSGCRSTLQAPYALPSDGDRGLAELVMERSAIEVEASRNTVGERLATAPGPHRSSWDAALLATSLSTGDLTPVAHLVPAPMHKIGAEMQATGEARYTQDVAPNGTVLSCHYVYSRRRFAKFAYPMSLPALVERLKARFAGIRAYVTFADIPHPAASNTYDPKDPGSYDPVFANSIVTAYGQPIGLVIADTDRQAREAALFIDRCIVYDQTDLSDPVGTVDEALAAGSLLTKPSSLSAVTRKGSDPHWLADPSAPRPGKVAVSGVQTTGGQAHFYMETQSTVAVPGEDGRLTLYSSSQHLATCQEATASALGLPVTRIEAKALRLGGGFGGKEVRAPYFAVAAAVAASVVGLPVRLALDRNVDMVMVGKRHPFIGRFAVGADPDGRIDGMKVMFDVDAGCSYDCTLAVTDLALLSADCAYNIPTFQASRRACRTNVQTNTAMRSFGVIQTTLIVEEAIEALAHRLGLRPETVRERNFYRDSTLTEMDVTPYGQRLLDCRINQVWSDFKRSVDFDHRVAGVEAFNAANRWRKRGISMIPIKYGISFTSRFLNQGSATVLAFAADGTVLVKHGGVEMGQGIHTKIARLAADALGISVSYIEVSGTSTLDVPNAVSTGASTGTDLNGGAVLAACKVLRERLRKACQDPQWSIPDWETNWHDLWPKIVKQASRQRVDLCSEALYASPLLADLEKMSPDGQIADPGQRVFYYFTYSIAASEVEVDVLTGEHTVLRTDLVYDSGKTINSTLDYGQIEGGFVQGLGNVTTEELYYAEDGRLMSDGTWTYKIPCSKTIPVEFNVDLLEYVPIPGAKTPLDDYGVRSAKSTGEPPLVLAVSAFFAIKHAIASARADAGNADWFELESPATIERIQTACRVAAPDYRLGV